MLEMDTLRLPCNTLIKNTDGYDISIDSSGQLQFAMLRESTNYDRSRVLNELIIPRNRALLQSSPHPRPPHL
jgi:hypothetical protein